MPKLIGRNQELTHLLGLLRADRAAVLTGEAGAGKTMLLREVANRFDRYGWTIVEVRPSEATRDLPLWPLHPLIPADGATDRDALTAGLRDSLAPPDGSSTLLVIDDAHHLDADSIAVLAELCTEPSWKVLATVRDGEPRDESLDSLWSADPASELAVRPFDADGTAILAGAVLGENVSPSLLAWLVDASRGNPLLVRELLLDARDREAIGLRDGEWKLLGRPAESPVGPRTLRCIQRRIGRVDDDARRLLDLLAVAGFLHAEQIPDDLAASLAELEDRRLLVRSTDAGGTRVTLDHPLVGEVVAAEMDDARRWSTTWSLVDLLGGSTLAPGDASRLAAWATSIGHPLDADRWVAAAREAIAGFDLDHALTWAQTAVATDRDHHGAHRSLGEALRLRGDLPAAAAALANAAATATDEDDIAATALDRAALVGFQRGDPAEAMAILRAAVERVDDPMRAMSLRSEAAVFGTLLGRFDDVMLVTAADPEVRRAADAVTRWTLGLNEVYALTMLGRVEAIDELAAALLDVDPTFLGERPHEMDLLLGMRGAARLQRGEFALGIAELEEALRRQREHRQFRGIAAAVLALLMSRVEDPRATEVVTEAVAQHAWMDPFGSTPIAAGIAALVASREGRSDEAASHLADFSEDFEDAGPWSAIWIGRARARVAFDAGDAELATAHCLRAGEVALATDHRAYAAITLHDGIHYGGAEQVVEPLEASVETTTGGHLLEVYPRHARAVADGDADAVAACSRQFMRVGATELAGEAQAQRAGILAAEGAFVEARRADFAGRAASTRTHTPAATPSIPDVVSDRELEVAVLAADGRTSAEIGAAVYLSNRTVDNHLRAVYRKLDLRGRDELPRLLL